MKKILILSILLITNFCRSQELNCQVSIITDINTEVTSAEKELFEQLKRTVYDFMNNTKWTDDKFKVEERINCQIQLQINTINNGSYTGSIQIQSSRPVFNGSYSSTVFNFQDDDFEFQFSLSTLILYTPSQFRDNLSSVLAFYAYYIIGLDYDTFSLKGGTPYFLKAQEIVSNAQSSGGKGWKSNEQGKRNRYWLIDNCLQQLFEPLRESMYEYHRNGLDQLYSSPTEARKAITTAMNKLTKVSSVRPGSINLASYVQGKRIELKNLYSDADQTEKTEIVNILKKVDPVNSSKYEEILL